MKFRKKPVVIEAMEWTGINVTEIKRFLGIDTIPWSAERDEIVIHTLEGDHIARKGDMIIRGVNGEYYPCKPDIFEKTYEKV